MTEPVIDPADNQLRASPAAPPKELRPNLGAVFTRRWVAELVLDLAGYTADANVHERVAIEPACGQGAFVSVMVERLVASCRLAGVPLANAARALIAMDIDPVAVRDTRAQVRRALRCSGLSAARARSLSDRWVRVGDFLLEARTLPHVDWVIGNPPYVRIEDVSKDTMGAYRREWPTMSGRADVYVGFFEAGLDRLAPDGRLAYICADRWMRNRYGASLRHLIDEHFAMDSCIVMHAVDAFEDRVAAYPAVNVIRNGPRRHSLVVDAGQNLDSAGANRLVKTWSRGTAPIPVDPDFRASWLPSWPSGGQSWPAGTPEALSLLAQLEGRLPTLSEAGVTVAVGVATGAESVYVTADPRLVEAERLIPTVGAKETTHGGIDWWGRYLVNPWNEDGLVDLDAFPKMAQHFARNRRTLQKRHVGQANPTRWWRTIDRIHPGIAAEPKLLIPDLKDRIHPVLDHGQYLPLHNLYYVTSQDWDLAVLGGLLLSDMANLFVEAYSVRMANGYLRVSAQYLRRVRVPDYDQVDRRARAGLRAAFWNRDIQAANEVAMRLYGITDHTLVQGRLRPGL